MKDTIVLNVPEGYEADLANSTTKSITCNKELSISNIYRELFQGKSYYYLDGDTSIGCGSSVRFCNNLDNCTTIRQCKKLLAFNMLLNVAKYLNNNRKESLKKDTNIFCLYHICIGQDDKPYIVETSSCFYGLGFINRKDAEKAIKILGEDTISLALSSDY